MVQMDELVSEAKWQDVVDGFALAPRQADITRLLLQGCGDKQIARNLGITVPTVRTHLSRMFARLKVEGRSELILRVLLRIRGMDGPAAVC